MLTRTFKSSPETLNALLLTCVLALETYASNNASTAASDWPKLRADAAAHRSAQPVRHVLQHDGCARSYFLVTPPRSEDQLLALVTVLHGGGGNALNVMQVTGFAAEALAG